MDSIAQKRIHTNFSVIFKHTMTNVYTRVTTYVAYGVFILISSLALIMVPSLLSDKLAKNASGIPNVLIIILQPLTYIVSFTLAISVWLVTSCVLELNETTFELSRPVSRQTFIGAKSVVALLAGLLMYLWYIVVFLICQSIIASKTVAHVEIFIDVNGFDYSTLFVPPLLITVFAIFMTFTLRPFIIKRDGLISIVIVLLMFLTYQLYPIVCNATSTDPDLRVGCLVLPVVVFGVGAIGTICSTIMVYKKLYVKV